MSGEGVVLELAGLLRSGMPANLARRELDADLARLGERQFAQFEAIWNLAMSAGGSIAGSIQSLGESFLADSRHQREIALAFAGPKATARLVAWLPSAGLVAGQLLGLHPIDAIFTNFVAFLALTFGAIFLVIGHFWTRSIVAKAAPNPDDPGIFFEAIRFGVLAGLPLTRAVSTATKTLGEHLNINIDESVLTKLDRLALLNRTTGSSIADLLSAEAYARREAKRFSESDALARLSVRLMIPLGAVTLPAFVLSTIVPIAISLLSNRQT